MEQNLFQCRDHREFLQGLMARRRTQKKSGGIRALSRSAGFRSPSTLSMILHGKRNLTPRVASKLAKALKLSSRERKYIFGLAQLSQAETEQEKREAEENLFEIRNGSDLRTLEWRQLRFLSVWYYPTLYVMAGQKTFRQDFVWLARRLGRGVKPEEVETALDDMLALGMLREDGGRLQQALGAVDTGKDVNNISTHRYHRQMMGLALEALDFPVELRGMNGLTFSVPKEKIQEVKDRIREFRRELNEHYSQFSDGDAVMQLNIQLFPLTEERR